MFKCDDTLTSYTHPVLKILFCCVLIVLIINRRELINIDNPYFDGLLTVLSLILGILSVLRIYISGAEMFLLYERRTEAKINIKKLKKQSRNYSVEYIISLLETNVNSLSQFPQAPTQLFIWTMKNTNLKAELMILFLSMINKRKNPDRAVGIF